MMNVFPMLLARIRRLIKFFWSHLLRKSFDRIFQQNAGQSGTRQSSRDKAIAYKKFDRVCWISINESLKRNRPPDDYDIDIIRQFYNDKLEKMLARFYEAIQRVDEFTHPTIIEEAIINLRYTLPVFLKYCIGVDCDEALAMQLRKDIDRMPGFSSQKTVLLQKFPDEFRTFIDTKNLYLVWSMVYDDQARMKQINERKYGQFCVAALYAYKNYQGAIQVDRLMNVINEKAYSAKNW